MAEAFNVDSLRALLVSNSAWSHGERLWLLDQVVSSAKRIEELETLGREGCCMGIKERMREELVNTQDEVRSLVERCEMLRKDNGEHARLRLEAETHAKELDAAGEEMSARITWLERKIEGLRNGVDCDPITGTEAVPLVVPDGSTPPPERFVNDPNQGGFFVPNRDQIKFTIAKCKEPDRCGQSYDCGHNYNCGCLYNCGCRWTAEEVNKVHVGAKELEGFFTPSLPPLEEHVDEKGFRLATYRACMTHPGQLAVALDKDGLGQCQYCVPKQDDARHSLEQEIQGTLLAVGAKWVPKGADLITAVGQQLRKGQQLEEKLLELFAEVAPKRGGMEYGTPSVYRRLNEILVTVGIDTPPRCTQCSSLFAESPQSTEDGGNWDMCVRCMTHKKAKENIGG